MPYSYEFFKKQAQRLHKFLPEFIAQHPDGGQLCHAQEFLARVNGYPNFHAAHEQMMSAAQMAELAELAGDERGAD